MLSNHSLIKFLFLTLLTISTAYANAEIIQQDSFSNYLLSPTKHINQHFYLYKVKLPQNTSFSPFILSLLSAEKKHLIQQTAANSPLYNPSARTKFVDTHDAAMTTIDDELVKIVQAEQSMDMQVANATNDDPCINEGCVTEEFVVR